ncbi:hypothetical protein F4810DRAFT_647016 [Camillea tinctor]|nr:hypothetical protein F4810DRAFT_647016 [Camillea tinctor]
MVRSSGCQFTYRGLSHNLNASRRVVAQSKTGLLNLSPIPSPPMATRRVIADSDDEDSGDEPLSPPGRELEPPQPEPLSPQHQPSSPNLQNSRNHISDITDPSFFQEVYSDQQNRALQQSHLVEKIVRQSQKASASGGETNTPIRSTGGEWDVPSSPIDLISGDRDREQTYGMDSKGQATQINKSIALGSSPKSAAKKRKISLYDAANPESPKFYIAQSNLTTMQKLEYQKVTISQNGYSALPGSLSNQKSSCATTIAYPTPSRYASSGPPLPWERPASASQEDRSHETADQMTSSPDIIALEHHRSSRKMSVASQPEDTFEPLAKSSSKSPSTSRIKERPQTLEDADELGQEEYWNSDANDDYQDNYKPRPSRRRTKASRIIEDDDFGEDPISTTNEGDQDKPIDVDVEVEAIPDAPNTSTVDDSSKPSQSEPKPTTQPKKRGRKKKQPVLEEINDSPSDESPVINQKPGSLASTNQTVVPTEKPKKKKRGRPRKSDTAKVEAVDTEQDVPAETSVISESEVVDAKQDQSASDDDDQETEKRKTKKMKVNDQAAGDEPGPLKNVDRNTRSPSAALSSKETSTKTAEKAAPENPPSKPEAKKTAASSTPQPKVPYRVGLSKRSRIAPLLKMIRK